MTAPTTTATPAPGSTTATFCATLVDEWVRAGVQHAVVAPGSRSTPLALALAARTEIALHVFHDERSAAFAALGVGLATGTPAVLLCTSGTAATHFHGAVVEAHQAEVPLVVCTADRPPELREVGAPQTIDQDRLYTTSVRWFHDPGVPDEAMRPVWRSIASRAVADAVGPRPGPTHLNLPFREPLVGPPGELPPGRPDGGPWHRPFVGRPVLDDRLVNALAAVLEHQRGVIVAGAGAGDPAAIHAFAASVGWPVLADPRSGCRLARSTTVAAFDEIVRHLGFAAAHTPTVVLRLGQPPASKVLNQWLARSGAVEVVVGATAAWVDPDHTSAAHVVADPTVLLTALTGQVVGASRTPWLARWQRAEATAQQVIDAVLAAHPEPTEPFVARAVVGALPARSTLVVSSSMPIRDVEWYGSSPSELSVLSNRGANGIDGVVSTAVGVALATGRPTVLLIGDVALLHDTNGLLGLADRGVDLTIVCVDNAGGGIFEFLPQATSVERERFERLFGTPHRVHVPGLAGVHGVPSWTVETAAEVGPAVAASVAEGGVRLVHIRTDRRANVGVHDELHRAVTAALDQRPS